MDLESIMPGEMSEEDKYCDIHCWNLKQKTMNEY